MQPLSMRASIYLPSHHPERGCILSTSLNLVDFHQKKVYLHLLPCISTGTRIGSAAGVRAPRPFAGDKIVARLAVDCCRYSYLIYNGSVHHWHAARPLQCEQLRQHLLPSLERMCQVKLSI